jgi:hypothetical protein
MARCKSTFTRRNGKVVQCENTSGHDSVHYSDDVWWPNKRGLPFNQKAQSLWRSCLRWLHDHV